MPWSCYSKVPDGALPTASIKVNHGLRASVSPMVFLPLIAMVNPAVVRSRDRLVTMGTRTRVPILGPVIVPVRGSRWIALVLQVVVPCQEHLVMIPILAQVMISGMHHVFVLEYRSTAKE